MTGHPPGHPLAPVPAIAPRPRPRPSRRGFEKAPAGTFASLQIDPGHVRGERGFVPPGETVMLAAFASGDQVHWQSHRASRSGGERG